MMNPMELVGLADRIKEVINDYGLSISKAAREIDVVESVLSGYIHGKCFPRLEIFANFCTTFHVNPAWMIYGTGEKYVERGGANHE